MLSLHGKHEEFYNFAKYKGNTEVFCLMVVTCVVAETVVTENAMQEQQKAIDNKYIVEICFPIFTNPVNTKHLYNIYTTYPTFIPTLYKCYTNVLFLLGNGLVEVT